MSLAERFWPKVDVRGPDECWLWTAATTEHGYGVMRPDGRRSGPTVKSHRVAWELAHGCPVPAGLRILHRCDNPPCCNPAHLFAGTQADNVADMHAKGRGNVGSVNGQAKLTEAAVADIRHRVAAGESQIELAREYGVSQATLSLAAAGKTWRHVPRA